MKPINTPKVGDIVKHGFIVCHKEDIGDLQTAMEHEGFNCEAIRGPYTEEQLSYPAATRCLINHANAWKNIANLDGYVIVVEADFVPVRGMSSLPMPFKPDPDQKAMAWLYSVGPVIYGVDATCQAIYGHTAGAVAYVLDAAVARECLKVFETQMEQEPQQYGLWDVNMPIRLRHEHGVRCYIPYRMYGEHGGVANPEHNRNNVRGWHEADRLAGRLHFLPVYARKSRTVFLLHRLRGRARGFYRFALGKYFDTWPAWWRARENRRLKLFLVFRRLF